MPTAHTNGLPERCPAWCVRDHADETVIDALHVSSEEGVPAVLRRSAWGGSDDRVERGECTVVLWQRVGAQNTWVYVGASTTEGECGGLELSTESAGQLLGLLAARLGAEGVQMSPTT